MNWSERFAQEEAKLLKAIDAVDASSGRDTRSMQLMRTSLLDRLQQLRERQLGSLDVRLRGPATEFDSLPIEFASKLLELLQSAITQIGQVLNAEGLFPHGSIVEIRRATSLRLAGTVGGSFGLHFLPQIIGGRPEWHGIVLDRTVNKFVAVLASASEPAEDQLMDEITILDSRSMAKIDQLTNVLVDRETALELEWRWRSAPVTAVDADVASLRRVHETLRLGLQSERTSVETVPGTLVGANVRSHRFELMTEDRGPIGGVVDDSVSTESLESWFSRYGHAVLQITTDRAFGGTERRRHRLLAFHTI